MILTVDLSNPKPTYLQIVDCIRRAIATGALRSGDQLPTLRDAAVQARVNRNTISRAYLELEHLGIVRTRQGSGCFVAEAGPQMEKKERLKLLQRMADELVLEAYHSQVPVEEVLQMIRTSAKKLTKEASHV